MANLQGLPGGAEVWRVDGQWYAVYTAPGTNVPLMFLFERDELRKAAGATKADRTLTRRQANARGAITFGATSELDASLGQHPWDSFLTRIERDVDIAPWLADPEVVAHVASSWLRGTTPNLERTEWWQSRTDAERQWLERAAANPEQARVELRDNVNRTRSLMEAAGLSIPAQHGMTQWLANQWTTGRWSEDYLVEQLRRLADPYRSGEIDRDLQRLMRGVDYRTTREHEDTVRNMVSRWVGPSAAAGWSDDQVREWAGRLRNDPNGELQLVERLQRQRMSLFPEYDNPDLTYEDIAAPWRGFVQQHWGQTADEMDPLFSRLIRTNDAAQNLTTLRREGMNRGIQQVVNDLAADTMQAFGGQIRQAV